MALVLRFAGEPARARARLARAVEEELAHRGVEVRVEDTGAPGPPGCVEVSVEGRVLVEVTAEGEIPGVGAQRVVAALEAEGALGEGPGDVYTSEEEAAVAERLQSLGYLD